MKIICKILVFVNLLVFATSKNSHNNDSYKFNVRKLLTDWCSLTCGADKTPNIACEMEGKCDARKPCKFDTVIKAKLMKAHNKLRNQFAAGKEAQSGGLTVSNMMALSWDEDLAFTASCNVAKCGDMEHDKCRTTPKFPQTAGQNLWSYQLSVPGGDCVGESIKGVQQWYDEVKLVDADRIKADGEKYEFNHDTGHFTQVVWAETTHIGCALTKNEDDGQTKCVMACNYGPGGNMISARMFKEGTPCSQCPDGLKCGTKFNSLCGEGGAVNFRPNIGVMILFVLICSTFVK